MTRDSRRRAAAAASTFLRCPTATNTADAIRLQNENRHGDDEAPPGALVPAAGGGRAFVLVGGGDENTMEPMDAGVAALSGAAVGSVATLGAAILSGRAEARAQYAQWRRQQRRDAYVALLGALHDRDLAMDEILTALRAGPDPGAMDGNVARFVDLAREVHRAVEIVIMEGPPAMADAASRVIHASEDLSEVVRRMIAEAQASGDPSRADDLELAEHREHLTYQTIVDLRAEAAKTLDSRK